MFFKSLRLISYYFIWPSAIIFFIFTILFSYKIVVLESITELVLKSYGLTNPNVTINKISSKKIEITSVTNNNNDIAKNIILTYELDNLLNGKYRFKALKIDKFNLSKIEMPLHFTHNNNVFEKNYKDYYKNIISRFDIIQINELNSHLTLQENSIPITSHIDLAKKDRSLYNGVINTQIADSSKAIQFQKNVSFSINKIFINATIDETIYKNSVAIDFSQDFITQSGKLFIKSTELKFDRNGLQPSKFIKKVNIDNVEGIISLFSLTNWTVQRTTSKTKLYIRDLSFNYKDRTITKANGIVLFSSLFPLLTDKAQTITAQKIDVGFPIKHPILAFSIEKENSLKIENFIGQAFNGNIKIQDGYYDIHQGGFSYPIEIKNIDAQEILSLFDDKSLIINTKIEGAIKLIQDKNNFYIQNGLLKSTNEGELAYSPKLSKPDINLNNDDLKQLLKNISFKSLKIEIIETKQNNNLIRLIIEKNEDIKEPIIVELEIPRYQTDIIRVISSLKDLTASIN